ncbi:MAG: thrombospondin type 3 repeat-containing protein, partial [Deltaproteobacteria bacterium]
MRGILALVATGGALAAGGTAEAQSRGWYVDRYDPSPAGDTYFAAEQPWYNRRDPFALRFGIVADYAHNPLVVRSGDQGSGIATAIVQNMLVLHAQAGISFLDRINVHLSMPISLWQSGTAAEGLSPLSAVTAGDPRLGARVRIYNHADRDAFSLHAGGEFYFNAGLFGLGQSANTTDSGFRGRLHVNAAGRIGPVAWSLGAGVHIRPTINQSVTEIGTDVNFSAALAYVALEDRLTIGLELFGSTVVDRAFQWGYVNGELLAGVHYAIIDKILVGVGAGPGLLQGAGTPDVRVLAQLAWAPIQRAPGPVAPADSDRDGVLDPDDRCPTVPQGAHPDPARAGCPEDDRDRDTVLDSADQCPDVPGGEHVDPARAGCPEGDRDHDGVVDSTDQCPEQPRGDHQDAARAGCPDGDDDSDGVRNGLDECRTEPQGPSPDPDRAGCPIADRDHDSVPDATDHCPDQPGSPNPDPVRNGCPGLVRVENCSLNITSPVFFATSRDVILARSNAVLTAVAQALAAATNIRRVSIEGHTDDV